MIQSAMLLLGELGVDGASFSTVLERSGAPRGSIYHHFPGGKAQLVAEATRYSGDFLAQGLAGLDAGDPAASLEAAGAFWKTALEGTAFAQGCPIVAVTVDGERTPGAREAARDAFARFEELHVEHMRGAGVPEDRARSLATVFVAAMEGAIVLSRAQRSTDPIDRVVEELRALL